MFGDAICATHNACSVLRGNDRVCACSVEGYKAYRKRVINETGGDIVPYKRFVGSAYLLMSTTLSVLVIAIVWRPLLFIIAPFGLFAIFFYVLCFVYLGFGMASIRDVLDEDVSGEESCGADDDSDNKEKESVLYPAEMAEKVGMALDKWVKEGGYRDSSTNISKVRARFSFASRTERVFRSASAFHIPYLAFRYPTGGSPEDDSCASGIQQ